MSSTQYCNEFSILKYYDPWVVPHQILPSIAVIIGIEWKMVFLIMYAWESLEVLFLNCLRVSEEETSANSLISDPVQCLVGIIMAFFIMKMSKMEVPLFDKYSKTIPWASLFIIPGVTIIFGEEYVWIYIPLFIISMILLYMFSDMPDIAFALFFVYLVTVSLSVFLLENIFNSFYTGIAAAAVALLLLNICLKIFSK